MKRSIKTNFIYNLFYQIFALLTPLITAPYVSRVLGSEGIGQYSFTYSIVSYFVLFGSLGFQTYAQREIARKQGNKNEQSIIFWEIVFVKSISVALSLSAYLAFFFLGFYDAVYKTLFGILTINIVSNAFDVVFFFQGNELFKTITIRNIVIKIVGIVLIFVFVKGQNDVWIFCLCQSLALIVSNLSLWFGLPKHLARVNLKNLKLARHILPTLRLFLPTIAVSVYTMLDKTLIGVMVPGLNEVGQKYSDLENGYYEQSEKIVKIALTIISSLGTVMIPRNSNAIASGDYGGFKHNITVAIKYVFFIGLPMMFGLIAVARNFSIWFFGPGYDKVPTLIMMFSPLLIIIGLSNVLGIQYLLPMKKDSKYTIAIVCGAFLNLLLNLLLIPFLYSFGACVATLAAEISVTTIMFFFAKKDIHISSVFLNSWKYFVASLTMFGIVFLVQFFLSPSVLNTLLLMFEGAFIYFLMLLILKDDFVFATLQKIKTRNSKSTQ